MKPAWTLFAAALISTGALAQQPKQALQLPELDTDKDGSISRAEAKGMPVLLSRFDKLDTNEDGLLSRDELRAGGQSNRGSKELAGFADADANIDGKLSKEEVTTAMPSLVAEFSRIDSNADGSLTREEISAHLESAGATKKH